jgi:hypothetical protein
MKIEIIFQKVGLVPVGTNEAEQTINMQDPLGKPLSIYFNFVDGKAIMTIESWDDRNSIVRDFELELTDACWQDFLVHVFTKHIRPIAKESYPEFDGLIEVSASIFKS